MPSELIILGIDPGTAADSPNETNEPATPRKRTESASLFGRSRNRVIAGTAIILVGLVAAVDGVDGAGQIDRHEEIARLGVGGGSFGVGACFAGVGGGLVGAGGGGADAQPASSRTTAASTPGGSITISRDGFSCHFIAVPFHSFSPSRGKARRTPITGIICPPTIRRIEACQRRNPETKRRRPKKTK